MRIILASNSLRRQELLSQTGVKFEVIPSNFEESRVQLPPVKLVEYFAYMKAKDVSESIKEEALVIGSDTVVYCDEIMGKPRNREEAFCMLLLGGSSTVISGVKYKYCNRESLTEHESTR